MKKYGRWFVCALLLALILLPSCKKKQEEQTGRVYYIYCVNNEETGIVSHEYQTETMERNVLLEELLQQLSLASDKLQYKAPLAGSFSLLGYSITEEQLVLNFSEEYRKQPATTEVLVRAAIVRTLSQIDGVAHISFQVKEEPLTDLFGNVVGVMNADTFIDNDGNEINTYEKVKLTLYFANESGDKLRKVSRNVVFNSNISMERLVVEQLLAGPAKGENGYPTINPATKIQSVTVKDGTCYVNLDGSFLTQPYKVTSDVTVYSITNSLAELSDVNKVQITIDSTTDKELKDNVPLSTVFERNLEIVENESP